MGRRPYDRRNRILRPSTVSKVLNRVGVRDAAGDRATIEASRLRHSSSVNEPIAVKFQVLQCRYQALHTFPRSVNGPARG